MKMPIIWDGMTWRKATKKEYENGIINVPVYGKANYIMPTVWNLPIVDTDIMTGSKVVACGRSVQFRFSCARTTETAQAVRAYKLGLDRDERASVKFNYMKSGSHYTFETTFCGSCSGLKKFQAFIEKLSSVTSIKTLYVRMRQEETGETSNFKKIPYSNTIISVVRYLRDNLIIKDYDEIKINDLEVIPEDNIYGLIVRFKK